MAMIQLDFNPPAKKLRQFGWITPIMLLIIGVGLRWRFGLPMTGVAGLGIAGILVFIASRISPKLVRPIFVGLMIIGFPVGWVVSVMLMALVYFGIITPVALIFRVMGRDALQRRWDRQRETYWTEYQRPDNVERYFRQF